VVRGTPVRFCRQNLVRKPKNTQQGRQMFHKSVFAAAALAAALAGCASSSPLAPYRQLDPAVFSRVVSDRSTRADVERDLGPPASVDRVYSWNGDILTYRWTSGDQPMFFWAYLDPQNVVRKTGEGMEFPIRMNDN
jgi:hypothetical protein